MQSINPAKALVAYAGLTTAALAYLLITAAAPVTATAKFDTITVGRINVREPDGTIRMIISNEAQAPAIIVKDKEYPHPTRQSAGMIFYNQEGTENGGLIFDGQRDGKGALHSRGSLTFDRYEQDQALQMVAQQDGADKIAGFNVFDRPDRLIDFASLGKMKQIPAGERQAFYRRSGIGRAKRMFMGRDSDGSSRVALRDGLGRERTRLVGHRWRHGADRLPRPRGSAVKSVTP